VDRPDVNQEEEESDKEDADKKDKGLESNTNEEVVQLDALETSSVRKELGVEDEELPNKSVLDVRLKEIGGDGKVLNEEASSIAVGKLIFNAVLGKKDDQFEETSNEEPNGEFDEYGLEMLLKELDKWTDEDTESLDDKPKSLLNEASKLVGSGEMKVELNTSLEELLEYWLDTYVTGLGMKFETLLENDDGKPKDREELLNKELLGDEDDELEGFGIHKLDEGLETPLEEDMPSGELLDAELLDEELLHGEFLGEELLDDEPDSGIIDDAIVRNEDVELVDGLVDGLIDELDRSLEYQIFVLLARQLVDQSELVDGDELNGLVDIPGNERDGLDPKLAT
jgi:hypothetical protein